MMKLKKYIAKKNPIKKTKNDEIYKNYFMRIGYYMILKIKKKKTLSLKFVS